MIIVNGKEINLTENTTVAEYLEQNQYQVKRIAVELNGDILPKYSYSDTMLKDGDRLEVVTFVRRRLTFMEETGLENMTENTEKEKVLSKEEIVAALNERHSPEKQKLLSAGRVAIAGLGGLGSNVAYALARIGVGHLHLIDFDVVDITNLNRQQYFMEHIGMYKTDALKSLLLKINPYLDIDTDCVKVTEENLTKLFYDEPIVCEAFDNPEAKAMLVNGILEHFPEKKLVSATGMAGYGSSNTIRTQKLMKNFYLCGDRETAPTYGNGLMAPRVAICAAHEANMITRLILGEEDV